MAEPLSTKTDADDVLGILRDYEHLISVDMTTKEIQHVHAWLRASRMDMTPELQEEWWNTPVGQFCKRLEDHLA